MPRGIGPCESIGRSRAFLNLRPCPQRSAAEFGAPPTGGLLGIGAAGPRRQSSLSAPASAVPSVRPTGIKYSTARWARELARQAGLTLIGRARGKRFVALAGTERIVFDLDLGEVEDEPARLSRKAGREDAAA